MNYNLEILNYLYQITEMSKDVIDQILKEVKYLEFKNILAEQLKNYETVLSKGDEILNGETRTTKVTNINPQAMAYLETKVNKLKEESSAHIADIIIKGSTEVILDVTTKLNKYSHINNNTKDLARRLIKIQQDNIESLKPFLNEI